MNQTINKLVKPVMESHSLTSARSDLSRDQERVIFLCMRDIYLKGFPSECEFTINHKDYAAIYGLSEQEARDDLRTAIKNMKGKTIRYYENWDNELAITEVDWSVKRVMAIKRGQYKLFLNPMLREILEPMAYDLHFTLMDIEQVGKIESKWSIKLYRALSQFRSTGKWYIAVDTLHERWSVPSSYRKNFNLFRTRVLNPAIKELRRHHIFKDVTLVETPNDGNKVTHLLFLFSPIKTLE
ncbi:MAG: RepB family plasmid replication initiator protein [Gammaproteobacteria bacterium]|nr:RepB family plasmid replication initiator protein [Gammaproteobacteria bacterium]